MTTHIPGPLRRSVGPDSFVDITGPGVTAEPREDGLEFDADLTPAQIAAIRDRMTSRSDDEQKARADIVTRRERVATADLTTAAGLEVLRRAVLAGLDFVRNA